MSENNKETIFTPNKREREETTVNINNSLKKAKLENNTPIIPPENTINNVSNTNTNINNNFNIIIQPGINNMYQPVANTQYNAMNYIRPNINMTSSTYNLYQNLAQYNKLGTYSGYNSNMNTINTMNYYNMNQSKNYLFNLF
jgi:hypothetical protein